ncbi:transcription factor bHLH123-like isoform X2 [Phragmites australis]|uniref:transcription factor bHLH123-like isoform X2 n=1 Tax=Phragmites australis TaxID=29695 RepID=UPI002D78240F|nr:transcription factor bHLH123-like isoform X2 [Phragmites australis]
MADEWWSSARTDGASACSTAPATDLMDVAESATSGTPVDFQPGLHGAATTASSSFLADPDMGWTQTYMGGGRTTAEATTSFNALLQLHGDASRHFLLDQPSSPSVLDQYEVDGTAPVASAASPSASLYGDNQYSSSAMSYGDTPAAPMTKPFSQQQFSGFLVSSMGSFGPAAEPPPLLLQALEPKRFKSNTEPAQDACSSVTRRSVPDSPAAAKKTRIETPSHLPTFKVRKEKLGDRITALQQLVSPFGKTDTASVLHEAIEYIKLLHDQVASLSSPYLRCGRPVKLQQQQGFLSGGRQRGEGGPAKPRAVPRPGGEHLHGGERDGAGVLAS